MPKASTARSTDKSRENIDLSAITPIRQARCKNLAGSATLTYDLGQDADGELYWRITHNSGAGLFNDDWVAFAAIQSALTTWPAETPMTGYVLHRLFPGRSVNTSSFLLAALLAEGVVRLLVGKRRQYEIADIDAFLERLKASHSTGQKPAPQTKPKPQRRMRKAAKDSD